MSTEPIIVEKLLNAPASKVWQALTNKNEVKQWYFDIAEFKPEVGFEFTFTGTNEGRTFIHLCKILEVIPERKLVHTWRYEGHAGNSVVTFELTPEGDKTLLRLTHRGVETFPATPDFLKSNFLMGWTHIIGTSIANYVEQG